MEIKMATDNSNQSQELKNTSYELFILLLSVLSIFNLLVFVIPRIDPVVEGVVALVDGFITVIFMVDFLCRFFTAESKSDYFFRNWGWADLLSSIPVQQLRIFRIFRIVRIIRLLRMYGWRNMVGEIRDNRAGSALYLTIFMVIIVLEFGGMGIVFAEANGQSLTCLVAATHPCRQRMARLEASPNVLQPLFCRLVRQQIVFEPIPRFLER